jgi:hypothetical protein
VLLAAGDNLERLHAEAAFALLCGVAPTPASSGKTNRHRLNRGGNREANWALYMLALGRMAWHEPTRAYVVRRTAEGLRKPEIIRCLKRFIAREVYRLLVTSTAPPAPRARRGRRACPPGARSRDGPAPRAAVRTLLVCARRELGPAARIRNRCLCTLGSAPRDAASAAIDGFELVATVPWAGDSSRCRTS